MRTKIIILVVLILALAAMGVRLYMQDGSPTESKDGIAYTPAQTPAREVPEGYSEYRTQQYHFSVLYPKEMRATQYGGGGDSFTVAFVGGPGGEEFQIFATPYKEAQVTSERFKQDVPSGVMMEPQEVVVAGERGTIFWSQDAKLGETREVWFIHKGILYEVTAKRELDEWLAAIMQSWQFVD